MRILFRAERCGLTGRVGKTTCFLQYFSAGFDYLGLTVYLVLDSTGNRFRGVEVLQLRACSELLRVFRCERDVNIASQRALFHFTVAYPRVFIEKLYLFDIRNDLFRAVEIGFRYHFYERYAAAVIVREA